MSQWLKSDPPPDVRELPIDELLALVRSDRNGLLGVLAAFEVCRRLTEGRA